MEMAERVKMDVLNPPTMWKTKKSGRTDEKGTGLPGWRSTPQQNMFEKLQKHQNHGIPKSFQAGMRAST